MTLVYINESKLVSLSNRLIHTIRENLDIKTYHGNIDLYAQDILSVLGIVCAYEINSLEGDNIDGERKKMERFLMGRIVYAARLKDRMRSKRNE
jgi:hypothetical protein